MHFRFHFARTLQASAYLLRLDKGIVDKLCEVTQRYRDIDDWELSEQTHAFKEWVDHYKGDASPIPWQAILLAQNKPEMVAVVERDETARQTLDAVFGPEP